MGVAVYLSIFLIPTFREQSLPGERHLPHQKKRMLAAALSLNLKTSVLS